MRHVDAGTHVRYNREREESIEQHQQGGTRNVRQTLSDAENPPVLCGSWLVWSRSAGSRVGYGSVRKEPTEYQLHLSSSYLPPLAIDGNPLCFYAPPSLSTTSCR